MSNCSLLVVVAIITSARTLRLKSDEAKKFGDDVFPASIWSQSIQSSSKFSRNLPTHPVQTITCDAQTLHQIQKPSTAAYNLWKPEREWFSQCEQDVRLAKVFPNTTGFFLESGASNGETDSNTLYFERKGWTGLLVEPNPQTFKVLQDKNRKSFLYNGALSTTGEAATIHLLLEEDCSQPADKWNNNGNGPECSEGSRIMEAARSDTVKVEMQPLANLLACTGHSTIDFWSLDVEGAESQILKSFPFANIEVGLLIIEMNKSEENNNEIVDVLRNHGFLECGVTVLDRIYVNPTYFTRRGLEIPSAC